MKLVSKHHSDYQEACTGWNRAINHAPTLIAFCESNQDIISAIKLAKHHKLPICVRSGRHHYEGDSYKDGSFVLDVSQLQTIQLDEIAQTVTIAAGVQNRQLYDTLAEHNYPFPGGGCPTVGVVGFTLGGGWGYSSRYLGLGCDNLIAAEVILWDGTVLLVDAHQHPELFWSLRGGGISVGVVSKMTYRLPKKEPIATRIFLDYQLPNNEAATTLLLWYQEWFPSLPRLINMKIVLYRNQQQILGIKLTGIAYADEQETKKLLAPLLKQPFLVTNDCKSGPVILANRWIQDNHPEFEYYKSGGRFVAKGLTEIQWRMLGKWLSQMPIEATYAAFTLYGLGGAVTDLSPVATAFAYREMQFIFGSQIVWENPEVTKSCQTWLQNHWPAIEMMSTGSFLNFPLHPQAETNYYGQHFTQIQQITQQYS